MVEEVLKEVKVEIARYKNNVLQKVKVLHLTSYASQSRKVLASKYSEIKLLIMQNNV